MKEILLAWRALLRDSGPTIARGKRATLDVIFILLPQAKWSVPGMVIEIVTSRTLAPYVSMFKKQKCSEVQRGSNPTMHPRCGDKSNTLSNMAHLFLRPSSFEINEGREPLFAVFFSDIMPLVYCSLFYNGKLPVRSSWCLFDLHFQRMSLKGFGVINIKIKHKTPLNW